MVMKPFLSRETGSKELVTSTYDNLLKEVKVDNELDYESRVWYVANSLQVSQ